MAACIRITFDDLRLRALTAFADRLASLDPEEVCERFLEAGKKYGDFDIESIATASADRSTGPLRCNGETRR